MLGDHLRHKMQLFGISGDPNTYKCLMTAGEKGVDIESIAVGDAANGGVHAQELQAMSPFGSVPCLRDHDFVVYGTAPIMSYLDDKGFGPSLVPRNGVVRAVQYQWIHIANEYVAPAVAKLLQNEDLDNAKATLATGLDALETQLRTRKQRGDFIVGEFSLADIHWAPYVHACFLANQSELISSREAVRTWWEHVKAHKSTSKEDFVASTLLPTWDEIKNNQLKSVTINV